jgi:hypothetical protein
MAAFGEAPGSWVYVLVNTISLSNTHTKATSVLGRIHPPKRKALGRLPDVEVQEVPQLHTRTRYAYETVTSRPAAARSASVAVYVWAPARAVRR